MKTLMLNGKNATTIIIAALVFFTSCTSGLKTSVTEPLPDSELEKLDVAQSKLYDKLQKILSRKSKSELVTLIDVTYANYFEFVHTVNENRDVWEKEAYDKWIKEYEIAFKAIDDCYHKWVEWERANVLDAKIEFKLRKIQIPNNKYGSKYIDCDLISHIGKLKKAYIDFGFDTPENKKRNKTEEFSVSIILGNTILNDAPVSDKLSFTDKPIYSMTPDYLIGLSSDEILSKYRLLTKVTLVILEDGTEIFSDSHLKQIPSPFVNLWKKESLQSVNYNKVEGFYDNEAVEIAALAGVQYQPLNQYIQTSVLEKMNGINAKLVPIYEELTFLN